MFTKAKTERRKIMAALIGFAILAVVSTVSAIRTTVNVADDEDKFYDRPCNY